MTPLLAEAYLHRLDPFVFEISDGIGPRWYGLSYVAGFVFALFLLRWFVRTGRSLLTRALVDDLIFQCIIGVLVGGRVGYAVFYDQSLLWGWSSSFPWWDLLAITKGGRSCHGGMIGVILACAHFAVRRKVSLLHTLDLTAFAAPLGLGPGRIANFVNGELWGRALPDQSVHPWWSVQYPEQILRADFARIDELRAALGASVEAGASFGTEVLRLVREGDPTVIEVLHRTLTVFYPSQIIQALTDGPILLGALALVWLKPRRPGVVGAWFLIIYGVLRIASEFFRQPDEGVALLAGLSRGQALSVFMVLAGIISVVVVARRPIERVGGLLRDAG